MIFICTSLGQLDYHNKDNWFKLGNNGTNDSDSSAGNTHNEAANPDVAGGYAANTTTPEDTDITCNATMQIVANQKDLDLWDLMDQTTYQILEQ